MSMPKATVYEHNGLMTCEHNIRCTGQGALMQAKPKSELMKQGAYDSLGRCVGGPHSRHISAALLGRDPVGHGPVEYRRTLRRTQPARYPAWPSVLALGLSRARQ